MRLVLLKRLLVGAPMPLAQARHERLGKAVALAVFASDPLSSVAYATEDSGSDAKTASATAFPRRSCRAWASGIGAPTSRRLRRTSRIHHRHYPGSASAEPGRPNFDGFLRWRARSVRHA